MKYVSFGVFLCVLALANAAATSKESKSSSEEDFREIAQDFKDKFNSTIFLDILNLYNQVEEKCPNLEDKIEDVFEKVGECIEDIKRGSDTLCYLIKNNWKKCATPLREMIISCMPKESQGIPIMVDKMIVGIIDQACQSTVEEILELFNPCGFNNDDEDIPACKEIMTAVDKYRNELPSKSLICSTVPKIKGCTKAVMEPTCKNPITKSSVMKFQEAIENSIKDECDALNKA